MNTRLRTLLFTLLTAFALAGCPTISPKAPSGILEQIEAAELTAQQLSASIVSLTCTKFVSQKCVEPGKAFMPDTAIKHHAQVQKARDALKTTLAIGAGQVGECLGATRTQAACLSSAKLLLAELERIVLQSQAGGKP